jgi:glutamyl-tRNA synthetase
MTVRGRFAPSPTGELHVGGARTALLAWLQVRSQGGTFVLRMEDLDAPRVVLGAAERQLEDLRGMGLDWDEGPDVGGPHGPYVQSLRIERYEAALAKLQAQGLIYPCYCSRSELLQVASAPHGPGEDGPRYPGICRTLSPSERERRESMGRRPCLRFRVRAGRVAFRDLLLGDVEQDVEETVGDFVVRRADGVFAYQLAVVVDDGLMGITDVLRGEDLASSTPRQLLLFEALGFPLPRFAHVPLVLGPDGGRLAKRDRSTSVRDLLRQAGGRELLIDSLATLSGLGPARSPSDLISRFTPGQLTRGPTRWIPLPTP